MKRCNAVACGVNKEGGCRLDKSPKSCLHRPQMEQLGELKTEFERLEKARVSGHRHAFALGFVIALVIGIAFGYLLPAIL